MNKYLENAEKIEFVVTDACTGRCIHCSAGGNKGNGESINPAVARDAVKKICGIYGIKTVMAFGGEPLLCLDTVEAIMSAARDMSVPRRQVITNGYFTSNIESIRSAAKRLANCGVNDLLLSVDAFHQQTIPLATVSVFAEEARDAGIPVRLQPAWLVSPIDKNPYNLKTRELLDSLAYLGLPESYGNVVFPEGNAKIFLADYFRDNKPDNPYTEDPCNVKCISFSANGDVLDGNVYDKDITDILDGYTP